MLWRAKNASVPIGRTAMDYVSFGYGARPLVLLPGLSDGLASVKGKALLLAPSCRAFMKTHTVYLFSRKRSLPEPYSIREMAADQAAAMKALGISDAHVLGVSQGGMIAQYLASDHPELVGKLVLAVTAPCVNDSIRGCVGAWIQMAEQGDHRQLMADTAEKSYSESRLQSMRKWYPLLGKIGKPKDYGRFLTQARAILRFDAVSELGKISCPTLILAGAEDRVVGVEASYTLNARIPSSILYVYPGLGHALYEEAKDFNSRVCRFLISGDA